MCGSWNRPSARQPAPSPPSTFQHMGVPPGRERRYRSARSSRSNASTSSHLAIVASHDQAAIGPAPAHTACGPGLPLAHARTSSQSSVPRPQTVLPATIRKQRPRPPPRMTGTVVSFDVEQFLQGHPDDHTCPDCAATSCSGMRRRASPRGRRKARDMALASYRRPCERRACALKPLVGRLHGGATG